MKIIYVENVRVPSERAHSYQIVQTCKWMARSGHEVILVNPARSQGRNVFDFYGLPQEIFKHVQLKALDPLSWPHVPFKPLAYAAQRFFFAKSLHEWAADITADVWYTRDPAMVDVLLDGRRKIILETHDSPDSNQSRWNRIKDQISFFVVITDGLRLRLRELGIPADKIHVAPDGYDPEDFVGMKSRDEARKELGLPTDCFVALYAGTFYPWKGVDLVIRAWEKTLDKAHLVLIGRPEKDAERLRGLLTEKARDRVHLIPAMPHARACALFSAGDIGLLTTSPKFEIGRQFTSPLKLFEYLAGGLPILASDVPSSHEILDDTVARFYPPTEEGFAENLNAILTDSSWLAQAKERVRQKVAPYTWEARTKGILGKIS